MPRMPMEMMQAMGQAAPPGGMPQGGPAMQQGQAPDHPLVNFSMTQIVGTPGEGTMVLDYADGSQETIRDTDFQQRGIPTEAVEAVFEATKVIAMAARGGGQAAPPPPEMQGGM